MVNQDGQILEQPTRVTGITVERLFNLGNYENIKYGVRVEIAQGDDPGRVLVSLERILNDLRAKSDGSEYELRKAQRILETPESELDEFDKKQLDSYRKQVGLHEEAIERRRKARQALATLDYTSERKDHKEDWADDDYNVEY